MFSLITNNSFLVNGLADIVCDNSVVKCNLRIVIIDATQSSISEKISEISAIDVCLVLILVNRMNEAHLLQYIPFPCPAYYIPLSHSVSVLKNEVNDMLLSLKSKRNCHYKVCGLNTRKWVSRKELMAVRMYFSGIAVPTIASTLFIRNKTALNYIRNSMDKLGLKLSLSSFNLFKVYEQLMKFTLIPDDFIHHDNHCPLRISYVRVCNHMYPL